MEFHDDRLSILGARCTRFGRELLDDLKDHPLMPQLVAELEKIQGTIYRMDIETTFMRLNKRS